MKLALIMLAAGNSRRFGSNKLLYSVGGKAMYLRILETLMKAKERMEKGEISCSITVVTQYQEIGRAASEMGAEVVYNPYPENGISSSLQLGLKANTNADACLFTVSDQPWLTEETIWGLIQKFLVSDKGIACLESGGRPGNPCIFSKDYYRELLALEGDTGGKRVINAHMEDVLMIPVIDARQLVDLDICPKKDTAFW
ncbi:MAG: nucleotidyltransferase family protein [Eubacteriales bacterium]|nr:nucleotidyltransferase family protein [Eubacteriales bacterium]